MPALQASERGHLARIFFWAGRLRGKARFFENSKRQDGFAIRGKKFLMSPKVWVELLAYFLGGIV
jgi:hypothetical protein